MKNIFTFFLILILAFELKAQRNILTEILKDRRAELSPAIENPDKYQIQIIYTQINRDAKNVPSFKEYDYRVDSSFYFYPASTVKMPASFLALEKLNKLKKYGISKETKFLVDTNNVGLKKLLDEGLEKNATTIAECIEKVFLVSDNFAFNYLYEFLTPQYLNETFWSKGYNDVLIQHRLSIPLSYEENMKTHKIIFFENNKEIYVQPPSKSIIEKSFRLKNTLLGKGYYKDGQLINEPMDFSKKNYVSLKTLTELLKAVIFPDYVPSSHRFDLTEEDYKFLYKYMSIPPRKSELFAGDTTYYDSYVKSFIFGGTKKNVPDYLKIFAKSGLAYGFLTEVAYIADIKNKVEFMLSAVISVNGNGIYNDDNYDYETIGIPFMANLGKVIYEYELQRERKFKPDLKRLWVE